MTDRWLVQYLANTGTWHTDTSGPHVYYDNHETALAWATRLRYIQNHVRIRHETITYEVIP